MEAQQVQRAHFDVSDPLSCSWIALDEDPEKIQRPNRSVAASQSRESRPGTLMPLSQHHVPRTVSGVSGSIA